MYCNGSASKSFATYNTRKSIISWHSDAHRRDISHRLQLLLGEAVQVAELVILLQHLLHELDILYLKRAPQSWYALQTRKTEQKIPRISRVTK